jgi:hypothetical protein
VLGRDGLVDSFLKFLLDGVFEYGGIVEVHICFSVEERVYLFKVVASLFDVLLDEGQGGLSGRGGTME